MLNHSSLAFPGIQVPPNTWKCIYRWSVYFLLSPASLVANERSLLSTFKSSRRATDRTSSIQNTVRQSGLDAIAGPTGINDDDDFLITNDFNRFICNEAKHNNLRESTSYKRYSGAVNVLRIDVSNFGSGISIIHLSLVVHSAADHILHGIFLFAFFLRAQKKRSSLRKSCSYYVFVPDAQTMVKSTENTLFIRTRRDSFPVSRNFFCVELGAFDALLFVCRVLPISPFQSTRTLHSVVCLHFICKYIECEVWANAFETWRARSLARAHSAYVCVHLSYSIASLLKKMCERRVFAAETGKCERKTLLKWLFKHKCTPAHAWAYAI